MTVRNVRNNNPGNIRLGARWEGLMPRDKMSPEQAAEKEFCVFETPAYGFRAAAKLLLNYNRLYGFTTLRQVAQKWAPSNENDTEAYVKFLCDYLGCDPDKDFGFRSKANLQALTKAIAIKESGRWLFSQSDLLKGVEMALAA